MTIAKILTGLALRAQIQDCHTVPAPSLKSERKIAGLMQQCFSTKSRRIETYDLFSAQGANRIQRRCAASRNHCRQERGKS